MIGLPTSVTSRISPAVAPPRSAASRSRSRTAARTATVISRSPPGFIITYDTRLMRSLAEPDLRVHGAGRRDDLARDEIADMRRYRGRTDVDRGAVHPVAQTRPHRDDVPIVVDRGGDAPVAGSQCRLKGLQHLQTATQVRQAPFLAQRRLDPAQVAGGVVHVRLARPLRKRRAHHRVDA